MSKLEDKLALQLVEEGIDKFERQFLFHPTKKYRFDFAWPEHKLACEVQGAIWIKGHHSYGAGLIEDYKKANEAAILGWRMIYVSSNMLVKKPKKNPENKLLAVNYIRRALKWQK